MGGWTSLHAGRSSWRNCCLLTSGKDWRQKEKGVRGMRGLDSVSDSMDMNLSKLREIAESRGAWRAAVHGVAEDRTRLSDWIITTYNPVALGSQIPLALSQLPSFYSRASTIWPSACFPEAWLLDSLPPHGPHGKTLDHYPSVSLCVCERREDGHLQVSILLLSLAGCEIGVEH